MEKDARDFVILISCILVGYTAFYFSGFNVPMKILKIRNSPFLTELHQRNLQDYKEDIVSLGIEIKKENDPIIINHLETEQHVLLRKMVTEIKIIPDKVPQQIQDFMQAHKQWLIDKDDNNEG